MSSAVKSFRNEPVDAFACNEVGMLISMMRKDAPTRPTQTLTRRSGPPAKQDQAAPAATQTPSGE